ncbi:MAG TPA: hypothetical protein VMV19_07160 [Xanthobacteraceae bacterium]|nr:hypothetical protein [Xanthobacteraceae bacterium]
MDIRTLCSRIAAGRVVAAIVAAFALSVSAAAQSVLSVGPRGVQRLVVEQLFDRGGRWYLIDDGGCYTYLESPGIRLVQGRLVLHAHLTSRLGQPTGNGCEGADFASNVTLSGRLRGGGHLLILDDIRIDRIDDESTRNAFNLALQVDPQLMPHVANIDVSEFVRQEVLATGGSRTRLDGFRILNITTRADAVVIKFDLSLSVP